MIVTKAYPIDTVVTQQLTCGECPLYDYRTDTLYWIDSGQPGVYAYSFTNQALSMLPTPCAVTSLVFRQVGGLVLGSPEGLFIATPEGIVQPWRVASPIPLTQLNDAIADPKGRLFIGQESFTDDQPDQTGFLFCCRPDGSAEVVEEGLSIANGMGFSPDQQTFYLIDTIPRVVYAYDYSPVTGAIRNRRMLKQFDRAQGLPDGMTVDAEGFLWVAMWFGQALIRLDPDGREAATVSLPVTQPTSVTFGGANKNRLFITSAAANWQTPLAPTDIKHNSPKGGSLYSTLVETTGVPDYQATI